MPTIFFGGGTPSLLPVKDVERILNACRQSFICDEEMEVTLESNPGDLSVEHLEGLKGVGVNRLSIGVQSFNDVHLLALTRRHSAAEAERAFWDGPGGGFRQREPGLDVRATETNLGGVEGKCRPRDKPGTRAFVAVCADAGRGHALHRDVYRGATPEPDADLAAEMYLYAMEALGKSGYGQYEISNWAKAGRECQHNLVYWRNEEYVGIGAGAHSFLGGCRFSEERNPRRYVGRVRELGKEGGWGRLLLENSETVAETLQKGGARYRKWRLFRRAVEMGETMMMGLRLMEGVSEERFGVRFGCKLGVGVRERAGGVTRTGSVGGGRG